MMVNPNSQFNPYQQQPQGQFGPPPQQFQQFGPPPGQMFGPMPGAPQGVGMPSGGAIRQHESGGFADDSNGNLSGGGILSSIFSLKGLVGLAAAGAAAFLGYKMIFKKDETGGTTSSKTGENDGNDSEDESGGLAAQPRSDKSKSTASTAPHDPSRCTDAHTRTQEQEEVEVTPSRVQPSSASTSAEPSSTQQSV